MTRMPPEEHDNRGLALYGIELSYQCDSPEEDNIIDRHIAESQVYALLDIAAAIRETKTDNANDAILKATS